MRITGSGPGGGDAEEGVFVAMNDFHGGFDFSPDQSLNVAMSIILVGVPTLERYINSSNMPGESGIGMSRVWLDDFGRFHE
jgi:hypothetical protein